MFFCTIKIDVKINITVHKVI